MSNTLEFTLGAVGHCTEATATELTWVWDIPPQQKGDLILTVTSSKGKSAPVKIGTVGELGLVAHWPMNDGTGNTIHDASFNRNDLAAQQTQVSSFVPVWSADTPGVQAGSGGCIQSGVFIDFVNNGQIQLLKESAVGLPTGNEPRTVCYWYKFLTTAVGFVSVEIGTPTETEERAFYDRFSDVSDSTLVTAPAREDDTGQQRSTVVAPASPNMWHHAAVTFDGTTWKFYEDGALVNHGTFAPINSAADYVEIYVSPSPLGGQTTRMKDVRIYDLALSAAQVLALFTG